MDYQFRKIPSPSPSPRGRGKMVFTVKGEAE
jgi:hypothetical protein